MLVGNNDFRIFKGLVLLLNQVSTKLKTGVHVGPSCNDDLYDAYE